MSASDMLELVPQSTKSVSEALARLCPLLLLQLHNSACTTPQPVHTKSLRPASLAGKLHKMCNCLKFEIKSIVGFHCHNGCWEINQCTKCCLH